MCRVEGAVKIDGTNRTSFYCNIINTCIRPYVNVIPCGDSFQYEPSEPVWNDISDVISERPVAVVESVLIPAPIITNFAVTVTPGTEHCRANKWYRHLQLQYWHW